MSELTKAQRRALANAAKRDGGNVCPVVGVHAAAEMALLYALLRKGLIEGMDENGMGVPRINDAGRAALTQNA